MKRKQMILAGTVLHWQILERCHRVLWTYNRIVTLQNVQVFAWCLTFCVLPGIVFLQNSNNAICDIIYIRKPENYKENQGFLLPLDKKGEPTADNDQWSLIMDDGSLFLTPKYWFVTRVQNCHEIKNWTPLKLVYVMFMNIHRLHLAIWSLILDGHSWPLVVW